MSLLSSPTIKSEQESKKMTIINGEQNNIYKRFDESEMTPVMLAEYRRLQHELQCQEALLVLMQKLKTNQRLISQTNTNTNSNTTNNNNGIKQRTTTPITATKLSQQPSLTDGKPPLTATKQPLVKFIILKIFFFIIFYSRIIQIDQYQQNHHIQINILLIVQIIILKYHNNNHRKILCQHLRLLVSQIIIIIIIIAHYQQQLLEYQRQYRQQQRKIRLLHQLQAIHQKV
jgi:hypothetical protein